MSVCRSGSEEGESCGGPKTVRMCQLSSPCGSFRIRFNHQSALSPLLFHQRTNFLFFLSSGNINNGFPGIQIYFYSHRWAVFNGRGWIPQRQRGALSGFHPSHGTQRLPSERVTGAFCF